MSQLMVEETWTSGRKRGFKTEAVTHSSDRPAQEAISTPPHSLVRPCRAQEPHKLKTDSGAFLAVCLGTGHLDLTNAICKTGTK